MSENMAETPDDETIGFCIDCWEAFRYDDCGGYNPPCACGMHCRSCHEDAQRDDDDYDDPRDDDDTDSGPLVGRGEQKANDLSGSVQAG